eukprot:scaffold14038_cov35-Attheya_sp.AAC.1
MDMTEQIVVAGNNIRAPVKLTATAEDIIFEQKSKRLHSSVSIRLSLRNLMENGGLGQQVGGIVSEPAPASTTTRQSSQLAAADASVSDGVRSSGANEVRDLMDRAAAVVATQRRGEPIRQVVH